MYKSEDEVSGSEIVCANVSIGDIENSSRLCLLMQVYKPIYKFASYACLSVINRKFVWLN